MHAAASHRLAPPSRRRLAAPPCFTAHIELYSNRAPDVARRVVEVGRSKYPKNVAYAAAALDLLVPTMDDASTLRVVGGLRPVRAAGLLTLGRNFAGAQIRGCCSSGLWRRCRPNKRRPCGTGALLLLVLLFVVVDLSTHRLPEAFFFSFFLGCVVGSAACPRFRRAFSCRVLAADSLRVCHLLVPCPARSISSCAPTPGRLAGCTAAHRFRLHGCCL